MNGPTSAAARMLVMITARFTAPSRRAHSDTAVGHLHQEAVDVLELTRTFFLGEPEALESFKEKLGYYQGASRCSGRPPAAALQ